MSLWIVSIYLILAGMAAFILSWPSPFASNLAKLLGVASAFVQAGSGLLLLLGRKSGSRLYLMGIPVIIILQAIQVGTVMGFTDDDYPIRAFGPLVVYAIVALFLNRKAAKTWLLEASDRTKAS